MGNSLAVFTNLGDIDYNLGFYKRFDKTTTMFISTPWALHSRVHPLNHFPSDSGRCFVKRDDELSCGISGTKLRKYSSLVPYLRNNGYQQIFIIGGAYSNNVVGALQLAREMQLKIRLFLLKPWSLSVCGNYKIARLFIDLQDIFWVTRSDWPNVESRALEEAQKQTLKTYVLHEGASNEASRSGAMSLASDIIHNEAQLGVQFEHIFIDAGTGFSAAALMEGLYQSRHNAMVHILLLYDSAECFEKKLHQWRMGLHHKYCCFKPYTGRAFGAFNQQLKHEMKKIAVEEGILTDPVYSVKLFHSTRKYIEEHSLSGHKLIIHSGGALSVADYAPLSDL